MARIQTAAAERTQQNHDLQDQVAAELGRTVTIAEAAAHRRRIRKGDKLVLLASDVTIDLDELSHVGTLLASIKDFRIQPGGYATLSLVTDGRSYADILTQAALVSQSHNLIIDLHLIPKDEDEEDDDDAETFSTRVG